jgi:hypothetical protein
VYGQLTRIEFASAAQREAALKLISANVERIRALRGFEAAYYLDVDALRITVVTMFDSREDLEGIHLEDERLQREARELGVKFLGTDRYPVVAFATSDAP